MYVHSTRSSFSVLVAREVSWLKRSECYLLPCSTPAAGWSVWKHRGWSCTSWSDPFRSLWRETHGSPHHRPRPEQQSGSCRPEPEPNRGMKTITHENKEKPSVMLTRTTLTEPKRQMVDRFHWAHCLNSIQEVLIWQRIQWVAEVFTPLLIFSFHCLTAWNVNEQSVWI